MKGGNFYGAAVDRQIGSAGLARPAVTNIGAMDAAGIPKSDISGGRRRTQRKKMTAKAMKRILKKNGMKVSGKKATLTKRMKKARLMKGGAEQEIPTGGVVGFTGKGAVAGLGGFQDVSGGKPNNVVPLPA